MENLKFEFKKKQFLKVSNNFTNKNLIIFSNGSRQRFKKWLKYEQFLHDLGLMHKKLYNKFALNLIKNSIYYKIKTLINGMVYILKHMIKNNILSKNLETQPYFYSLIIKLNNKIYTLIQIKKLNIFNFYTKILLLYKILILYNRN